MKTKCEWQKAANHSLSAFENKEFHSEFPKWAKLSGQRKRDN